MFAKKSLTIFGFMLVDDPEFSICFGHCFLQLFYDFYYPICLELKPSKISYKSIRILLEFVELTPKILRVRVRIFLTPFQLVSINLAFVSCNWLVIYVSHKILSERPQSILIIDWRYGGN